MMLYGYTNEKTGGRALRLFAIYGYSASWCNIVDILVTVGIKNMTDGEGFTI